jgi:hypothetical protein
VHAAAGTAAAVLVAAIVIYRTVRGIPPVGAATEQPTAQVDVRCRPSITAPGRSAPASAPAAGGPATTSTLLLDKPRMRRQAE